MADEFQVLILDNEVTVGEFVTAPPLPWTRLTDREGKFLAGEEYPKLLTEAQAKFEMKNWDQVSLQNIMHSLAELSASVDFVVFGNNAGQGLPLAQCLPRDWIGERAAIIYARSLPEIDAYTRLGYQIFFRRSEAVAHLREVARKADRPLALWFINTIQHNELNYHDPP